MAGTHARACRSGQSPKIVCVYSEQSKETIEAAINARDIKSLAPSQALKSNTVQSCTHIVALAGAEHINAALALDADIVLAGRTTDTAIIACLPLQRSEHPGASWHAAKIAECGALC